MTMSLRRRRTLGQPKVYCSESMMSGFKATQIQSLTVSLNPDKV